MSADPDDEEATAVDVDSAEDGQEAHTGEGVETIGGRESTREEDRDWEFSLSDIEQREREGDDEDGGGNVAGSLTSDQPLEPGDIDRENAIFVLLGVLIVVGLIASLVVAL